MKIVKKILALALIGVMTLSMASCSGQSWIVNYDGEEMPVGVFTYYAYNAYQMYSYYGGITRDEALNKQTIPDTNEAGESIEVAADEFINDYALDQVLYLCELNKRFKDAGLTLTDEELSEIETNVAEEYAAAQKFYETNGVAKSSVIYGSTSGKYGVMQKKLFDYTYGKGGPKEVTEEALKKYYDENYVSYTYIYEQTTSSDGEMTDEEKNKLKSDYETMKTGIENGTVDFESIAKDYQDAYSTDYTSGKNGTPMVTNQITDSELMTELLKLKNEEIKVLELDGRIYLLQRHDISTNGYFEEYHDAIFENMNYSDFQSEIKNASKEAKYELNDRAFKKFGIRKLEIDGATL